MTRLGRRLAPLGAILLLVSALTAAPAGARPDGPPPPPVPNLPQDWVAWVAGRVLPRSRLAAAVVGRVLQDLQQLGSNTVTILRQMIQARVEVQEARTLRLDVTDRELARAFDDLDAQVRAKTNGQKNLREEIRLQGNTVRWFREQLRQQLLREKIAGHAKYLGTTLRPLDEEAKIAQIQVVMGRLLESAVVRYGMRTALAPEPEPLGAGVVATVNGEPITLEQFGEELVRRLPRDRIRDILVQECKAVLTAEYALSVQDMEGVMAEERERWHATRELATQEALRHLSWEEYVKFRYGLSLEDLKHDRYFRGTYGLLRRLRDSVRPEEIAKEYDFHRATLYGESILIHDVQIAFSSANALLGGGGGGRDYAAALRLANDVLRRHAAGVPWEQIAGEINQRQVSGRPDPTYQSRRIRVRNQGNESILFEKASALRDGDVSRPVETLAEVHVFKRLEYFPPLSFEQARDLVRERLATRKAHEWFESQLDDPAVVRIRWPLPEDEEE
jgi:hypothetical protein